MTTTEQSPSSSDFERAKAIIRKTADKNASRIASGLPGLSYEEIAASLDEAFNLITPERIGA